MQQTVLAQVISTPQPDVATALALIASVTPVDADYNAQEKDLIANLCRELDRPNIAPEARKAIQEKIDVIQRQVQARLWTTAPCAEGWATKPTVSSANPNTAHWYSE